MPCEFWLHPVAAAWNEPEGSGKTYQLSVTGPLLEESQAARSAVAPAVASNTPNRLVVLPVREPLLCTLSRPIANSSPNPNPPTTSLYPASGFD
jgi:hypothetical protein